MPIVYLPEPSADELQRFADCVDSIPEPYIPYSNYPVYAVVEATDGKLYGGMNIENAAYTPTQHAEETAVTAALLDGVRDRLGDGWLKTVYVRTNSPGAPCGHCRQVIAEWANPDTTWIGVDLRDGTVLHALFSELLPLAFGRTYIDDMPH